MQEQTSCPEQWHDVTLANVFQRVLSDENGYQESNGWRHAYVDDVGAWKLHLYAESQQDWLNILLACLPYLHERQIYHKTLPNKDYLPVYFEEHEQKGKLITVYSPDDMTLKQIIYDLDTLFCKQGFIVSDSAIYGDAPIGHSGRIFYRYDRDLMGNYRLNDGLYCPQGVSDPFCYWRLEYTLSGYLAGRENFEAVLEAWKILPFEQQVKIRLEKISGGQLFLSSLKDSQPFLLNGRWATETTLAAGDWLQLNAKTRLQILK